jgi:hypothetical protein
MNIEYSFRANPSTLCLVAALTLIAPMALAQQSSTAALESKPHVAAATASRPEADAGAAAGAQSPALTHQQAGEEMAVEDEELTYEPLQVGDATQGLLAWQRSGEISSATPRPIAGAVANRSYERYLKSFEFPIPERFGSSVKSSTGSSSGSGASK